MSYAQTLGRLLNQRLVTHREFRERVEYARRAVGEFWDRLARELLHAADEINEAANRQKLVVDITRPAQAAMEVVLQCGDSLLEVKLESCPEEAPLLKWRTWSWPSRRTDYSRHTVLKHARWDTVVAFIGDTPVDTEKLSEHLLRALVDERLSDLERRDRIETGD